MFFIACLSAQICSFYLHSDHKAQGLSITESTFSCICNSSCCSPTFELRLSKLFACIMDIQLLQKKSLGQTDKRCQWRQSGEKKNIYKADSGHLLIRQQSGRQQIRCRWMHAHGDSMGTFTLLLCESAPVLPWEKNPHGAFEGTPESLPSSATNISRKSNCLAHSICYSCLLLEREDHLCST